MVNKEELIGVHGPTLGAAISKTNAAQTAAEAARDAAEAINTRLGGLSFAVDPADKGLNITYTY